MSKRTAANSVPISERAIQQRVNRVLAGEGKILKKTRGIFAERDLGRYYILRNNSVVSHGIDLETLAREMGQLETFERLILKD